MLDNHGLSQFTGMCLRRLQNLWWTPHLHSCLLFDNTTQNQLTGVLWKQTITLLMRMQDELLLEKSTHNNWSPLGTRTMWIHVKDKVMHGKPKRTKREGEDCDHVGHQLSLSTVSSWFRFCQSYHASGLGFICHFITATWNTNLHCEQLSFQNK